MSEFVMWEPTDDTAYGDSTLGTYSMGMAFDRMVVERAHDGRWLGSVYVVSAPRDPDTDSIAFDLFPDDEDDAFLLVNQEDFDTEAEAVTWCESGDFTRHIKINAELNDDDDDDDDDDGDWEDLES